MRAGELLTLIINFFRLYLYCHS